MFFKRYIIALLLLSLSSSAFAAGGGSKQGKQSRKRCPKEIAASIPGLRVLRDSSALGPELEALMDTYSQKFVRDRFDSDRQVALIHAHLKFGDDFSSLALELPAKKTKDLTEEQRAEVLRFLNSRNSRSYGIALGLPSIMKHQDQREQFENLWTLTGGDNDELGKKLKALTPDLEKDKIARERAIEFEQGLFLRFLVLEALHSDKVISFRGRNFSTGGVMLACPGYQVVIHFAKEGDLEDIYVSFYDEPTLIRNFLPTKPDRKKSGASRKPPSKANTAAGKIDTPEIFPNMINGFPIHLAKAADGSSPIENWLKQKSSRDLDIIRSQLQSVLEGDNIQSYPIAESRFIFVLGGEDAGFAVYAMVIRDSEDEQRIYLLKGGSSAKQDFKSDFVDAKKIGLAIQ